MKRPNVTVNTNIDKRLSSCIGESISRIVSTISDAIASGDKLFFCNTH